MILYNYKAKNLEGRVSNGKCWCHSHYDLIKYLKEKGLFLISFNISTGKKKLFQRRAGAKQLALLCNYFYSLLGSGINVVEVINIIEKQIDSKPIRKSLRDMENMVRHGMQISDSMKVYPGLYPVLLINMVTVGEESGKLEEIFHKLSILYNQESKIRNKIVKVLIYPCILSIFSIITVQFMVAFIVPIFMNMLISLNAPIPSTTRLVYAIGSFTNKNIIWILGIVIALIIGIKHSKKIELIKKYFYFLATKIMITRKLMLQITGIRFSRYLGILMGSGIQIIAALKLTCSMMRSSFIQEKLQKAIIYIETGSSISEAVSLQDILPKLLCSMIKVGEETGNLDELLIRSSNILEEDLYNIIDKLVVLIEPLMIIILSGIIGGIIISFVLPMFSIMDSI